MLFFLLDIFHIMQNTNPNNDDNRNLKRQIDLLLGDTDVFEKSEKDGDGDGNKNQSKYETGNQNKLSRPSTSDISKLKTNRRLNPMENVPLLGIRGYNRDALGFILLDGEIVEWISDDLTGTKPNKENERTSSTETMTSNNTV